MHPDLKKFPLEFVQRLEKIVPKGLFSQVIEGYKNEKPTTFRINHLKASDSDQVIRDISKAGVDVDPIRLIPGAYVVKKGSFKKLQDSKSYTEGHIYLQSLSSMLPPLILKPQPGERVLDMAASPGGKTTQMAAMMKNAGTLIALEPDKIRFDRLKSNCKKQCAEMVECIQTRGESFNSEEKFDKILLDAPCSSEGTFLINQPMTYRHWSMDFVRTISKLQGKLLDHALSLLKPGGTLVYSTCALSPEENEEVIQSVLQTHPDLKIIHTKLAAGSTIPSFASWNGKPFSFNGGLRVLPTKMWEGFFVTHVSKSI